MISFRRLSPEARADIEADVERDMREHQEPDGSYSCDSHVMVGYVLAALDRYFAPTQTPTQESGEKG